LPVCCVLFLTVLSCSSSLTGFGPYATGGVGVELAGVATFVPPVTAGENEFLLTIVNTDKSNTHRVVVTPSTDVPVSQDVASCSIEVVPVTCLAPTVLVDLVVASGPAPSITIPPTAPSCQTKTVYIGAPASTGGDTTDTTPTLTETVPTSAADCPSFSSLTGGMGGCGG
jgi:hypothetical protein